MSEYKCPEPGCDYHVGFAWQCVTDEDFEQQDYYHQGLEDHIHMHQEQKRARRSRDEKQSAYWVKVSPATAAFLDANGFMESHLDKQGVEVANPLWRPMPVDLRLLSLDSEVLNALRVSPLSALSRDLECASGPSDVSAGRLGSSNEVAEKDRFGLTRFVFKDSEGAARLDIELNITASLNFDSQRDGGLRLSLSPRGEPLDERVSDARFSLQSQVTVDVNDRFHESSLSVGDASVDAVGGTSESTERGHAPESPDMKEPSAVAAAEGDETNNPER